MPVRPSFTGHADQNTLKILKNGGAKMRETGQHNKNWKKSIMTPLPLYVTWWTGKFLKGRLYVNKLTSVSII